MIKTKTSPDWRGLGTVLVRVVLTALVAVLAVWVMSLAYLLVSPPAV